MLSNISFILPVLIWPMGADGNSDTIKSVFSPLVGRELKSRLTYLNDIEARWNVNFINPSARDRSFIEANRVEGVRFYEALQFTFYCEYPGSDEARSILNYDDQDFPVLDLWNHLLIDSLKIEIFCIQLSADLAEPGGALAGTGVMKVGNKLSIYRPPYTHMWECYDEMLEKAPKSPPISFDKCWSYLNKIKGLRWGTGSTPAAKAIAAFTYLYDEGAWAEGRLAPLVWACAGLEAFYGDGPGERFAQLRQKIPAFLNLAEDSSDKDIRHIYSVRSKLMHGNRAMSSSVSGHDGIPEKHFDEESSARFFGKFYLCETLREAIRRDIELPVFKVVSV